MLWIIGGLMTLYGAIGRRLQGLSKEEMPLDRNQSRMILVWVPLALGLMALGVLNGWTWWLALLIGLIPGLWSWLPGAYNTFVVWRLLGENVHTAFTEMIQGAVGTAVSVLLLLLL